MPAHLVNLVGPEHHATCLLFFFFSTKRNLNDGFLSTQPPANMHYTHTHRSKSVYFQVYTCMRGWPPTATIRHVKQECPKNLATLVRRVRAHRSNSHNAHSLAAQPVLA